LVEYNSVLYLNKLLERYKVPLFKNTKKVRDEVASVLQNSNVDMTWNDVKQELDRNPETRYDKFQGGFMLEWVKGACHLNSVSRSARLAGDITKALKYEEMLEEMVNTGGIVSERYKPMKSHIPEPKTSFKDLEGSQVKTNSK